MTRPSCIASNALAPALERRAQPDDRSGSVDSGFEQVDHALPDPVVVAERSLQAHVLQHQRVRCRSAMPSGDQPTFVTCPSGRTSCSADSERVGSRRRRRITRSAPIGRQRTDDGRRDPRSGR